MEYIKYQGSTMDIGGLSDPFVVDWDGDGLQDLIVGQYYDHQAPPEDHGKIRFFPNQGTSTTPIYNTFDYIEADGVDIICSYG